jgi:two-component system phosphate regulon sensor histidine kinase PhoR
VKRLSDLLSDVVNVSEMESGRLSLNRTTLLMKNIAAQAVADLAEKAKLCGITVTNDVPAKLEAYANERQVLQVMLNLVDNAIKFTGEGGFVTITGKETTTHVLISVQDTGVGIQPAHIDRVFERFYRVDKAASGKLGGAGLGLSMVKEIMSAHGGLVTVASEPGHGSTFTIAFRRVKGSA